MAVYNELDRQLDELQLDVANLRVLQKQAWDQERRVMAEGYIWWLHASEIDGYLDSVYAQHHITHNRVSIGRNFRPLVKLFFNSRVTETDLTQWQAALRRVHEEVTANAAHYQYDTVERIAHFIKTNGGKSGLAGYHNKSQNANDQALDEATEDDPVGLFEISDSELTAVLQQEAKRFYTGRSQQPITLPALHWTSDGFSVVVVKNHGSAAQLVGTTNSATLIDAALVSTYRNDFAALPTTMRAVLEPLHVLNEPNILASSYEKLRELGNVQDAWSDLGRKEKSHRRLIYRPATADFLLSYLGVDASVVLICKPKLPVLSRERGDLFLPQSTRRSVETRLLHQAMFNLFTTSTPDQFNTVSPGFIAANYVRLDTKLVLEDVDGITASMIKNVVTNINHAPLSLIPFYESLGTPRWQASCNQAAFNHSWQADVGLDWLRDFTTSFLNKWIPAYGRKANRAVNKTLNLSMNPQQLLIGYELDPKVGYDNVLSLPLPSGSAQGGVMLTVRSSDFAFALKQISDLDVMGQINMQASEAAMLVKFETQCSSYRLWIPASDDRGERLTKCFEPYNPEMSSGFDMPLDHDDLMPEPTAQEDALVEKNLDRLNERKKRNERKKLKELKKLSRLKR